MTANEQLQSALIKRSSYLQLLIRRIQNDFLKALDSTNREVKGMLIEEVPKITSGLNTKTSDGRFAVIGNQYKKIKKPVYDKAEQEYLVAMNKLVNDEAEFIAKSMQKTIPFDVAFNPITETTIDNITAFAAYDGKNINQWFNNVSAGDYNRIEGSVRAAVNQGATTDQVIQSVIGTKSRTTGKYSGDIQVSRNQAETLVRTTTNGVVNQSNEAFYKANDDIISFVVYTAVMDGRTSVICASLDGNKYKNGEGPVPPLHPNCRSTRVPVFDDIGLIGNKPTVGGTNFREQGKKDYINSRKKKGDSTKKAEAKWNNLSNSSKNGYLNKARKNYGKEVIGSVPAETTYGQWLKKQDSKFQNDVLGVTNAKKFRSGEMTLDKFTDKLGKPLTLDELRSKYPDVYD
jgi:SPP1 gp7 family putative phage head morphogenesis protein